MDELTLTTITHPSSLTRFLRDRQAAHSAIMGSLPANLGPNPRASSNCLWALPGNHTLLVQTTVPFTADNFGPNASEVRPRLTQGDKITAAVDIACLYTPMSDVPLELRAALKADGGKAYRSRLAVVPQPRRSEWFINRMRRVGFDVNPTALTLSKIRQADLGRRRGKIPFFTARFEATILDDKLANDAIRDGVGKGRNFGLGLIRSTTSI